MGSGSVVTRAQSESPICAAERPKSEDRRPSRIAWLDMLFYAAIALLLYCRLFAFPAIPYADNQIDGALFLSDAARMLHGQTLYRDFFDFNFPGAYVVNYWALMLVGMRGWIAAATLLLLGLALARITLGFSRKILPGYAAYLPPVFFIAFGFRLVLDVTHHWFSVVLVLCAASVLLGGRYAAARLALVGALCGAAAWFTQTRGPIAALAFCLFLCWDCRRHGDAWRTIALRVCWLLGSFTAVLGLLLGYHIAMAAPRVFFADTILFPLLNFPKLERINSPDVYGIDLWPAALSPPEITRSAEIGLLYLLVPGMYVLGFLRLCRLRRHTPNEISAEALRALALALILGPLMFLCIANSASSSRLAYDSYFAFLLLTWYLSPIRRKQARWRPRIGQWSAGELLLAALALLAVGTMLRGFRSRPVDIIQSPTGRIAFHVNSDLPRWLSENTKPGDYLFEAAWSSYYQLFDLRNPTRICYLTNSGYTRPEDVRAAVEGLRQHHVRFILMEEDMNNTLDVVNSEHLCELRSYVTTNYRLVRCFNRGVQLWERTAP